MTRNTLLTVATLCIVLASPGVARSEGDSPVEVGFSLAAFKVMNSEYSDDTVVSLSIPGGTLLFFPYRGAYVALPVSDKLTLEPQVGLTSIGEGDDFTTYLSLGGQIDLDLARRSTSTPYIFGVGTISYSHFGGGYDSDSEASFGAGLGLRRTIRDRAALRFELFYERFTDSKTNVFGANLRLGALF